MIRSLLIAVAGIILVLCQLCPAHGEAPSQKSYFTVALGAFKKSANAVALYEKMSRQLPEEDARYLRIHDVGNLFLVRVGRFNDRKDAEALRSRVKAIHADASVLWESADVGRILRINQGPDRNEAVLTETAQTRPSARGEAPSRPSPQREPDPPPPKKPSPKKMEEAPKSVIAGQHTVIDRALVRGVVLSVDPVSSMILGISPEQTLYRVVVKIIESEDFAEYPNILKDRIGQDVTCFSASEIQSDSVGAKIKGLVEYRGDERSRLFWISAIEKVDTASVPQ